MTITELICLLLVVPVGFAHFLPNEVSDGYSNHTILPRAITSDCRNANDCNVENSECLQGSCQCSPGFTVDGTLTRCLKVATGYNDECEESVQCSRFLGAGGFCSNGACVCPDRYHYLHGRCQESRGLNEPCKIDADCFVNTEYQAASCVNGVCKCSKGFYQREYSTCRRAAKNIGDECLIDADCAAVGKNVVCDSNKCSIEKKEDEVYIIVEEIIVFNQNADKNVEVNSNCTQDSDCKSLENSHCGVDKKCTCNLAHFPAKDLKGCIPEIGEECDTSDKQYKVEYSDCKNSMWTCQIDRVSLKNNQLCRKITKKINLSCQYNESCQLFGPKADCVNGKCTCTEGSHWLEDELFCWVSRHIDETCTNDNDCEAPTRSPKIGCKGKEGAKVCSCPEKTKPSDDKRYCILDYPELDSYCEVNGDCGDGNLTCQFNQCKCKENYFESEGLCLTGLNAKCNIDDDCQLNNTICFENTCQCEENFVAGPEKQCITKSAYQETCQHDLQCSSVVRNSYCFFNETTSEEFWKESGDEDEGEDEEDELGFCECIPNYFYNNGSCFIRKRLGEECSMKGECSADSPIAVCRNGKCECPFDYKKVDRECRPVNKASASIHIQPWLILLAIFGAWKALG